MHLCQVVPYASYPPRRGGDHRTHGLVLEFVNQGDTVTRYCQGGTPETYRSLDLRRYIQIQENYRERRHLHPLHELVKAPMLLGYPNVFASNALRLTHDGLPKYLETADVVMVREPWQMPYVLDTIPQKTPVVFSSHNVEAERFDDIDRPAFDDRTTNRVHEVERVAVTEADAVVCTSERDAGVYREMYGTETPILVAPNGTYERNIREHRPNSDVAVRVRQEYGIDELTTVCLFMGSDYQPNVEAAEETILIARDLENHTEPIHFMIMGSVGDSLDDQTLPDNVTITGYVEDNFEAHFDASDIALNPMISGGGTNIKLFDYFARGVPVVSTPFGVRGVNVQNDVHLVVSELDEFTEHIVELTTNHSKNQRLVSQSRELTREYYTWESSSAQLRGYFTNRGYISYD